MITKLKLRCREIIYISTRLKNKDLYNYLYRLVDGVRNLETIIEVDIKYSGFRKELIRVVYTMSINSFSLPIYYKVINAIPDIFNRKFIIQSTGYGV